MEWSWLQGLQDKPHHEENFADYMSLGKVRELDARFRKDVEAFVRQWEDSMETRPHYDPQEDGTLALFSWGEVMRHVIAHEIHHIGQLAVWSRELGRKPVSANLIGKGLIPPKKPQAEH